MKLRVESRSDLEISPLCSRDWPHVFSAVSNPKVLERLDIPTPYDESKAREFCTRAESTRYSFLNGDFPVVFAVRDVSKGGETVGCIDLRVSDSTTPFFVIDPHFVSRDRKSCEVGYWLAEEYQGQGIMTLVVQSVFQYARDVMHVTFCCAACRRNNPASMRTIEKAGLVLRQEEEGVLYYWDK